MDVDVVDDVECCFSGDLLSFLLFFKKVPFLSMGTSSAGWTKAKAAFFVKSRKSDCFCTKFGAVMA